MKISEYIAALQSIQAEHGDLEMEEGTIYESRPARGPQVEYLRILTGRQRQRRLWYTGLDESLKGKKVCRI